MCEEFHKLLAVYQEAVVKYTENLVLLDGYRRKLSKQDYDRLAQAVEQKRLASEEARRNLEEHAASHGCLPSTESCDVPID
jgi:hypothetical protein